MVEEWLWAGMICPIVRPPQRPPNYGLHGVHRQVHNGLSALVNSLHTMHQWKRGKAVRWVQWFLDPIRIQARTATGVASEDERKDKKKVPLKIEQTAAAESVKSDGWDTMCDHLEGEGPIIWLCAETNLGLGTHGSTIGNTGVKTCTVRGLF